MVIQHNLPAINSHRNLGINNSKTAKNLEKLSSGYRINRAGDDAAGLAISEKMRGQISGLGMAEQNANNGISLIQTAEGGLNETHSILQRMRELAVQSSNGTYQDSDREQIELEYQALKQEIDRIASYTNYNGIKLLDGTVGGTMLSNTSAALQIQGTDAELFTAMGVKTTAPVVPVLGIAAGSASSVLTASDKQVKREIILANVPAGGTVDGFAKPVTGDFKELAGQQAAVNTVHADLANLDDSATLIMTSDGAGGWTVTIEGATSKALQEAKASYDASKGHIEIKSKDGNGLISFDIGKPDATSSVGDPNKGNGYAAGSTITVNTHIATDSTGKDVAGKSIMTKISVNGETNKYQTSAIAGATTTGTLSYNYNKDTKMWDVSGTLTLSNNGITENVDVAFSFDPKKNTAALDFEVDLKGDGSTLKLSVPANAFGEPGEADLSTATINVNVSGTLGSTQSLASMEAYKYAAPASPSPDQARADRMLKAMGLDNASQFNINNALSNGSTADKLLFESLNNKDAYIITRKGTAEADRNVYAKDDKSERYETLLQVNGTSYLGSLEGGNWNFKDENGTIVATLSNTKLATETGTVRFNTGDITNEKYYEKFLVDKEGAQIGSENVSNLVFQIGANGAEDQRVGMYVLNMSSDNIGNHDKGNFVSASTILTRDEANIAVDTLDSAINYVSAQRANLGALQNRLEHTLNNLGVTKENLTAAESSIRDVDMAKEMMDFTKNNILVQASQAMLAQANSLPQGVLSLLR